jgi:hypothetical protein
MSDGAPLARIVVSTTLSCSSIGGTRRDTEGSGKHGGTQGFVVFCVIFRVLHVVWLGQLFCLCFGMKYVLVSGILGCTLTWYEYEDTF